MTTDTTQLVSCARCEEEIDLNLSDMNAVFFADYACEVHEKNSCPFDGEGCNEVDTDFYLGWCCLEEVIDEANSAGLIRD